MISFLALDFLKLFTRDIYLLRIGKIIYLLFESAASIKTTKTVKKTLC